MIRTNLDDAATNLRALIDAALSGEDVFITTNGEQGAHEVKLIAVTVRAGKVKPQFGSARGLIEVHEDFDEPLEEFEEYMYRCRCYSIRTRCSGLSKATRG